MTIQLPAIRQGLPRHPGGEPWPPLTEGAALATPAGPAVVPVATAPVLVQPEATAVSEEPTLVPGEAPEIPAATAPTNSPAATATQPVNIRQGLPRIPSGGPWPPAATAMVAAPVPAAPTAAPVSVQAVATNAPVAPESATAPPTSPTTSTRSSVSRKDVRQGLSRKAGGSPWPPLDAFPKYAAAAQPEAAPANPAAPAVPPAPVALVDAPDALSVPAVAPAATTPSAAQPERTAPVRPAPAATSTPKSDAANDKAHQAAAKHGPLTTRQWVLAGILGAFCALGIATAVVLVARGIAGIDAVESFMERYPGEYHLPDSAPLGFPSWLAWNHFFNFFLMVLIIRSGMLVRHQKKPPAYWSSKRSPKVSINLWLHLGLDLLWIINGLVFLVLLFATGHWMRIVPTSWEVFPNAISAALQYLTLDWPTENGWVNYNSLQQLAYFTTVFIAAPVAAITGFRLSAFWPKNVPALTRKYPIEVARALHFPTMLYFVVFILVHVFLVFSTGALRNLNHMYAAQGSTDPAAYADNWLGLIMFGVSLLTIAGAWIACRPILLTPVAQIFGKVTSR